MNYSYPESLRNLIDSYKKLPGIGEKTAERLALAILEMEEAQVKRFSDSLLNVKTKIKRCNNCNNYAEEDLCQICKDNSRLKDIICVVEDCKNLAAFEKIGSFSGIYYVLGGLISPLDGIGPEDIHIKGLLNRVKENAVKEVILALNPCIEGETTMLYISKKLASKDVKVTKIAYGIPIGSDMDYIDSMTLEIALQGRTIIT